MTDSPRRLTVCDVLAETKVLIAAGTHGRHTLAGFLKIALGESPGSRMLEMSHTHRTLIMDAWRMIEEALHRLNYTGSLNDWLYTGRSVRQVVDLIDYACTGILHPSLVTT